MKRLFIGCFLLIFSVAILAVSSKKIDASDRIKKQDMCGTKKCDRSPVKKKDTRQFFWEPVSRMMIVVP